MFAYNTLNWPFLSIWVKWPYFPVPESLMNQPLLDTFDTLPRTPASDVKKHGWRGVMQSVAHHGKVLVTNHNTPEAVILSTAEYRAMVEAVRAAQAQVPNTL